MVEISDKDFIAHAKDLLPVMNKLTKRLGVLKAFNTVAAIATPAATLAVGTAYKTLPVLTEALDKVTSPAGLFLGAAALTASVLQASRQMKAKIRKDFFQIWDQQDPSTRQYTMGLLEEQFRNPKFKSAKHAISIQDLDYRNDRNKLVWGVTAASAVAYLPISPLTYFWHQQILERSEAHVLHVASNMQTHFLTKVKDGPTLSN